MSFDALTNDDTAFRTDNIIQNFHRKPKFFIYFYKPKLSFFVNKQ